jgi:hypothetical protein
MTQLTVKTNISDTYPNPSNAVARAGFANLWDVVNETTQAAEVVLASAATTNIGGQTSTKLQVTGTTTITSLGTTYRGPIFMRFSGALILTHNSTTLVLPKGVNVLTAANDTCVFVPKTTSGVVDGWVCISYPQSWVGGSGATGGLGNAIFYENDTTMTSNYTLGKNASMTGPLNINTGIVLTIPTGRRLVIL